MPDVKPSPPDHVEVPVALKTAIQDLISRVGGDGFLMELQTDDGQRYYLAFGTPDTMRGFVEALPPALPQGQLPLIH